MRSVFIASERRSVTAVLEGREARQIPRAVGRQTHQRPSPQSASSGACALTVALRAEVRRRERAIQMSRFVADARLEHLKGRVVGGETRDRRVHRMGGQTRDGSGSEGLFGANERHVVLRHSKGPEVREPEVREGLSRDSRLVFD